MIKFVFGVLLLVGASLANAQVTPVIVSPRPVSCTQVCSPSLGACSTICN